MNGTLFPGTVSFELGPVVIHDAGATAADVADRMVLFLCKLGHRVVTTAVTTAVQLGSGAVQDVVDVSADNPHPNGWPGLFPDVMPEEQT